MKQFKLRLTALFALGALAFSACATGVDVADKPAESSSANQEESAPATQATLPDPRTLQGVSAVTGIPDPTPLEEKFSQQLPVTVTDEEGNQVTVSDTSRILALDLTGTLSRVVISLGYGDSLVGRSISSTESTLADLPVVTENGHSLNPESILALQPTLILVDRSLGPPEAVDQVREAGVPVVLITQDRSIDNVEDIITAVARALGVEAAGKKLSERSLSEIKAAQKQIEAWVPDKPLRAAFLYVRGTAGVFFILGEGTGAQQLIEGVGATDLASENGVKEVTPATAEALVSLNPEVIFVMEKGLESTGGVDGLFDRPGMAEIAAASNRRVISIPDGVSLSFGPQTGDILREVAKALYGVRE